MTSPQETADLTENIAIGIRSLHSATTTKRCICLGNESGRWITDEDYQFCFTTSGESPVEFSTTMTEDEWRVVNAVVRRAIENKPILNVEEPKATTKFRKNYEISDFDRLPENLDPNEHVKPFRMNDNAVAGHSFGSLK